MDGFEVLDYPYHPKPRRVLLAAAVLAVFAVGLAQMAHGNQEGLELEDLIPLSPRAATAFLWCGAVLMALASAAGLAMAYGAVRRPGRLVLTETELRLPRRLFSEQVQVVRLVEMSRLDQQQVKSQRMLQIRHRGGRLTIVASMLPEPQNFERLLMELGQRVPQRVWGAGFRRG